jgi:hypothetical protein
VNTGYTFVNGKTIYRRCFSGTITNTTPSGFFTTLINAGIIETVIRFEGNYNAGGTGRITPIPWQPDSNSDLSAYLYLTTTEGLRLFTYASNRTNAPYVVWVEYTKL